MVAILACVFAAIAVSVVDARRPFDERVPRSFASALSSAQPGAVVLPASCRKERVDFYDCSAPVRRSGRRTSVALRYRVSLRGDLCWSAVRLSPDNESLKRAGLRNALLSGCLGS